MVFIMKAVVKMGFSSLFTSMKSQGKYHHYFQTYSSYSKYIEFINNEKFVFVSLKIHVLKENGNPNNFKLCYVSNNMFKHAD